MPTTYTYTAALAVATAIKTSIATVASIQTYTGAALNGAIGAGSMKPARTISVTAASSGGSYVAGSTIVITGTDYSGGVLTETLTLAGTGGNETLVTAAGFKTVVSVVIAAQVNTSGAWTIGVRDVSFNTATRPYRIRATAAGDLKLGYAGGTVTDIVPALAAKEVIDVSPDKIYGDASTTVVGLTLFFK